MLRKIARRILANPRFGSPPPPLRPRSLRAERNSSSLVPSYKIAFRIRSNASGRRSASAGMASSVKAARNSSGPVLPNMARRTRLTKLLAMRSPTVRARPTTPRSAGRSKSRGLLEAEGQDEDAARGVPLADARTGRTGCLVLPHNDAGMRCERAVGRTMAGRSASLSQPSEQLFVGHPSTHHAGVMRPCERPEPFWRRTDIAQRSTKPVWTQALLRLAGDFALR